MTQPARWFARQVLPPLVLLLIVLGLWDIAIVAFNIPPYLVPRPLAVANAAWLHSAELGRATLTTARGALCGFAASLVLGSLVALVFSQSRVLQRAMFPYAIFLQTVPIVAIAPLVINCFGTGFVSVALVAGIISLFPVLTNVTTGLTSIDENLLELFELHNASRWQVLWKLRLPSAAPYLVTGARVSCGLAVIGAIVGEFFAGYDPNARGLGYFITQTSGRMKIDYLFAAVGCCTCLGVTIFATVTLIGNLIAARWQPTAARSTPA